MTDILSLDIDSEGIAIISLDIKGESLNTLSSPVLKALEESIETVANRSDVRALILMSGKEDSFIAGADLREISANFNNPQNVEALIDRGHTLLNQIAALPIPTIAVINGVCLGGGTELALAFTYRICTDNSKTVMALPEVTLGIMPGWGGTQRCPRLIGLQPALNMILTGKQLNPKEAFRQHLVDRVVPWPFMRSEAIAFAHEILDEKSAKKILHRRHRCDVSTCLLEKNPIGRAFLFWQAERQLNKKLKGHYPAPLVALRTIKETYTLPLEDGLKREKAIFLESLTGAFSLAPNLVGIFFAQETAKKDPGVTGDVAVKAITAAGVLGAGTMGSGISWLFSFKDFPVRFREIDLDRVAKGYGAIYAIYEVYVRKLRKLKKDQANLKFHSVSGTTDFSGFSATDIVVEAATEDFEGKKKLFAELEKHIDADTIIATNTSSLSVAKLAEGLTHPERFIGMHFFNPVNRMPLIEVVPGPKTSPEVIATVVALCKKLDKVPLVVQDSPGFLVNRIAIAGTAEATRLLQEGVDMERIDKLMLDFGMPMGLFALSDEIGIDVMNKVSHLFESSFGERMKAPELLQKMVDDGLLGRKVGKGFYVYHGKNSKPNSAIRKVIAKLDIPKIEVSDESIRERILYPMINEAARCLEEGIIAKPAYVDLALILGTGFPPFRGGLLRYADSIGVGTVALRLEEMVAAGGMRFAPCETLLEMKRQGATFY